MGIETRKICNFNVSKWHLITTITPYISSKINEGKKVKMISEENMKNMAQMFLEKVILNNKKKKEIMSVNWESKKNLIEYEKLDNYLKDMVKENNNISIIINGKRDFIEEINSNINKWIKQNEENKIEMDIINCYEIIGFSNVKDILDIHDKILNTSGEKDIEEVFEGYKEGDTNKLNAI